MSLNGQELEIFRAGAHGIPGKREFTPEELQGVVANYATAGHEAPIVVGHPKLNSPAFGWFKSLRVDGDTLFGTPHQVMPEFEEAVRNHHFKKRSAAFDRTPDGKGWMLRHVGFLGGTPPVIKGLADATFATAEYVEGEEYSTEGDVEMAEQQVDKKSLKEMIRESIADVFGGPKTKEVQQVDVAALEQRLTDKFSAELKTTKEALDAKDKEFADFRAEHEKTTKSASAAAAVAKLKGEGKWLPAFDRMHVSELFSAIADGNTVEFEFADDSGAKHKLGTLDALTTLVGGIAKFVPRGVEFGDEQAKAATEVKVVETPAGVNVDAGSQQFDLAIKAYAKEHNVDYQAAMRALIGQGKSSASYVPASAGAV